MTNFAISCHLDRLFHKLVVDSVFHKQAGRAGTGFGVVPEQPVVRGGHRLLQVTVAEHHKRILPTKLQSATLDSLRTSSLEM